ncbi:electron transferring flavoprotein dehydrogenase [Sulfurimonas gotlandica GD1]|uniref:Electron transfer flavoprotein-ubiquinone oxidoreductase n=1 Tax=Sulfurimonas gotlandica (strain DSM 19862 / JCM 16533 / GD1) TaxID=929558 RepID=B6BK79_SULGG|nr:electron-transfer flavoprotein:ubiquinone oxidoreductase [Sulfurimonas gotlandica]EDZ62587.1 electron transfer flavoprotein-ubiquinone oxidoreductase [Sulfurimonas gotlandica GD1]EHP31173.1 electron transferring flavoprotein dehydrogenase [Sulfurimonas gotlandica GD1]
MDNISTDVLIVGGGPSGLATAISLADKLKQRGENKKIMLIEKGSSIGSHILSGAVIRPQVFQHLLTTGEFDGIPFDSIVGADEVAKLNDNDTQIVLPFHPPYMSNEGNYIASLGQVCKYLATLAQDRGVEIYTGFAVDSVVYDSNNKVIGVKTKDTGVDHHGVKQKNFQEGTTVNASITVFAEGTRGSAVKTVIEKLNLDAGKNPQIYSLGVKEIWSIPEGNIKAGEVKHTFGYPLRDKEEFGGGFIYGMTENRVAVGLVVGLDYQDPSFDVHAAMQVWKTHPYVSKILEGGSVLEAGAKTLPEGGWNSVPKYYADNMMIVGDSAGFLSTARLKGVHLAVRSGICAATAAAEALVKNDTSKASLSRYEELVNSSSIYTELYPIRNMRAVMQDGMLLGGLKMGVQLITGGACLMVPKVEDDYITTKKINEFSIQPFNERFADKLEYDKKLTFDKVTTVYYSKAMHDEIQPVHLVVNNKEQFNSSNINEYGLAEASMCPAEVYELHVDKKSGNKSLRIHAENCVHCKTCDIKSPNSGITWTTPYGGDGPDYNFM